MSASGAHPAMIPPGEALDAAPADQMAEIEARWQHLPGGFHGERKRIKTHITAVTDAAPSMSSEELCWLAIAAASAWIPPTGTG